MENHEPARTLKCVVVTPERAFLDETVDFVAVPMLDGELGVMPGRMPLIGRLGYGELRTVRSHKVDRYFIDGGFVQVRNNIVTLLTSRAIKAEEIKVDAAEQSLADILAQTIKPETEQSQFRELERARAMIRVAGHIHPGEQH